VTDRRRLGSAAAIVAGGVLLSRLLGFGREVVIAALLGRTAQADLYQYAFAIPDYAYYLVAGGFLSITLIPILARYLESDDARGANEAFSAVFRTVALALVAITAVAGVAARPLVAAVFPEVVGNDAVRLVTMTRLALLLQVLFALGALFTAGQFVRRRFLVPALGPIVYNAGIIAGGAIGSLMGNPSPEAFLLGGVGGALIGSFGLQWLGAHAVGVRLVRPPRHHPAVREYLTLAVPLMVGQTVIALDEQWPRWFGQFGPAGTTAGLQWARRLTMLPVGVIAQAAGVAAYPFLARLAARGDDEGLRRTVNRSIRAGVTIAAPVTAVVVLASEPLVRLAFQWGAFTTQDTRVVAGLLGLYALAIPVWVLHQVVTRAFYAERRMWTPVVLGTAVTAVTVPSLFWVRGNGTGIAAVSTAAVSAYGLLIAIAWYRSTGRRDVAQMGTFAVRVVTAAALATLLAGGVRFGPIGDAVTWVVAFGGIGTAIGLDEIPRAARRLLRRA